MTNITGIYNETNWTYSLSEGNYSWNAQACDNSSNCNWTESNFTLTADRTNPSISVSISDTSIQTSESTTITCSSTDTNLANLTIYIDGSTKNSSSSLASISYVYSPSSSGTKTVNCTAYDKASNANSTASSISVSSPSSGSSSGSSSSDESGGGTATETSAVSYSIVYDIMPADEKVTIEPTKSVINLTGVEKFSVTSSIQAASVEFRIASVENSTQKIDDAYKYFSISASNLADSYITEAEIAFKVEKSWIKDGNYDEDTVKLNRYHDGEWAALDTNLTDESSAYYEYRAATPGFSTFAITAEKLPVAISNITTTATGAGANETAKTGTEKATRNIILYLAIIAAIAIAIAVTIIILSKPKDHGKFHPKA
jgi:PGF-pre-PGF domain-containing protein